MQIPYVEIKEGTIVHTARGEYTVLADTEAMNNYLRSRGFRAHYDSQGMIVCTSDRYPQLKELDMHKKYFDVSSFIPYSDIISFSIENKKLKHMLRRD